MLMIRPLRRDSMCGSTARLIRKGPLRLTSITRSHASSGVSQTRRRSAPWGAAALLTSTSMRPKRASASATKRSASAARLTSPTMVRMRRPRPSISPARLSRPFQPSRISSSPSSFSLRVPPVATSVATMSAPARAKATEIARPIPRARAHPVTSTTLPSTSPMARTSSKDVRGIVLESGRPFAGAPGVSPDWRRSSTLQPASHPRPARQATPRRDEEDRVSDKVDQHCLDTLILKARTQNGWLDRPVTDDQLRQIYDIMKQGPTSANTCPARVLFLRTAEAKARLIPALSPGNVDKTKAAPVTAIIGYDTRFFELMPGKLFAHRPEMADNYAKNPPFAEITAFRNGTLQGAYFMLAARAIGLDIGGMSGFDNAKVDAEFFPDGRVKSNFLCNIGHGDPAKVMQKLPRLDFEEACRLL